MTTYRHGVESRSSADQDRVRTAELIASLSLATDLAMGLPMEYGLRSTVIAMRLCDRLGVDPGVASQTYYLCLLFYVGCTAPVDLSPDVFGDDESFTSYATPARFGSRPEMAAGMARAVAPPDERAYRRAWRVARHVPVLALHFPEVVAATCEVARMLSRDLGLGRDVSGLFVYEGERWDGKGMPDGVAGEDVPMAVRVAQVARDAAIQMTLGDFEFVAGLMRQRSGAAFDPSVAGLVADNPAEFLDLGSGSSLWEDTLAAEPRPWMMLETGAVDTALAAMGHFSEIGVPELVGHSAGVSELCATAGAVMSLDQGEISILRRAALVHDLGRVAVPARIWRKVDPLTVNDWEHVRLHAYHTERVLVRSSFLSHLVPTATSHHERLDGSGYHRGLGAPALDHLARLIAAADVYHALTEPRPHRLALSHDNAAGVLAEEAGSSRLGTEAVAAVLQAAGHRRPSLEGPAGLTEREMEVVRLLARGLQTKQVARRLQISPKTADFHIQSAYRKMDVSTRAGATLFAMQHGLVTWENSR